MFHFSESITNTKGDALTGYYLQVVDTTTGDAVDIYADDSATPIISTSGVANMVKVNSDGMADFWVEPGEYHLDIYGTDATTLIKRETQQPLGLNTITLASGSAVSTILALTGISSPVDRQAAILTHATRGGNFVFDASDLSTEVAADTAQGIYVAPSSDTTGASGAWVRKYDGHPKLEWFGGDASGTSDNASALTALASLYPYALVELSGHGSVYGFSQLNIPTGIRLRGAGKGDRDAFQTKILITGDGGGATFGRGFGGGVTMFGNLSELSGVCVSYNNPSLQCLLNMSAGGSTAIGRNRLEEFELSMESNITASTSNALALLVSNTVGVFIRRGRIRSPVGFKQNIKIGDATGGFFNGCHLEEIALGKHAEDIPNGVFHSANAQVEILCSTQAMSLRNFTFENGPNCIKAWGQGALTVLDPYMGDAPTFNIWLPSTAYAQGDYVCPSLVVTGDTTATSADIANISSTTSLFVGRAIKVPGAGASGALLTGRITAISGTTVTLDTAAGTSVTGAGLYYSDYAGHGFICSVAGTSGTSPPTWPTSGTVTDGTATWHELGPCAFINLSTGTTSDPVAKESVQIRGGIMIGNLCGIVGINGAPARPLYQISVSDMNLNNQLIAGHFDGAKSVKLTNINLGGYLGLGFHIRNGDVQADAVNDTNSNAVNKGAAIVAGTGSTGSVRGFTAPTGTNAAAIRYNGGPSLRLVTSAATVTPTFSNDIVSITAQASGLTLANWTGTAVPGFGMVIRIKDNGTARAISYGTKYRALGVTLPTTTVISKLTYLGCIYNATDDKIDVVSVAQEA